MVSIFKFWVEIFLISIKFSHPDSFAVFVRLLIYFHSLCVNAVQAKMCSTSMSVKRTRLYIMYKLMKSYISPPDGSRVMKQQET